MAMMRVEHEFDYTRPELKLLPKLDSTRKLASFKFSSSNSELKLELELELVSILSLDSVPVTYMHSM